MVLEQKNNSKQKINGKSKKEVAEALGRVNASAPFAGSPRLQSFLAYVVSETLAGRGGDIRGKSVAVDVYDRKLDGDASLNLVRVEARRLRRLLAEYYEEEGKEDSVRISIKSGGYQPHFEFVETDKPASEILPVQSTAQKQTRSTVLTLFALGSIVLLAAVFALQPHGTPSEDRSYPDRAALREHSVLSLQARNIAKQAQGMLFPVFDLQRQELALGMFRHAVSLDGSLSDGYSGVAQTLSVLGFFNPDRAVSQNLLSEARKFGHQSVGIAPTDPWANGALAFAMAASKDYTKALKYAQIAFELAPNDGHVLDLVGMVAILANEPELAATASDPDRRREGEGRFGSRNIWAVSQLMLGNYSNTIVAFEGAAASGAPVSAPSLLFQAVAHDQLSETRQAKALMTELQTTWPGFPAEFIVNAMFHEGSRVKEATLNLIFKFGI